MSEWVKVIAYVFVTLFLGLLLKELGFKGARLVIILGIVSVVGASILYLGKAVSSLSGLDGENREYVVAMLKMVGVGYAFGVCADICADLGEAGLAGAVSTFGRIEIIMLSVPFIKSIVEKGMALI